MTAARGFVTVSIGVLFLAGTLAADAAWKWSGTYGDTAVEMLILGDICAGRNIDEAHKPAIVERKGVKIGFLQYTARWYRDKDMIATSTEAGVAKIGSLDGITIDPGDLDRLRHDVMALRSQVDIVVVSHHNRDGSTAVQFGATKGTRAGRDRTKTEEYQKQFAHVALDSGADLVFPAPGAARR